MPINFADKETERLWNRRRSRRLPPDIQSRAFDALSILNDATLSDLHALPGGNRFKALSGDREGEYSLRINDQWRVYFRWSDEGAYDVRIGDDH